jgi:phosphoglycerate kinase
LEKMISMKLRAFQIKKVKKGERILMRVDFNVPVEKGRVLAGADMRLQAVVSDVKALSKQGTRVILMTHLGRPEGKVVKSLSTLVLAKRFSTLLKKDVKHISAIVGAEVEEVISSMKDGEVVMLENLRFDAREKKNSSPFASALAALADQYVNNAFAVSHRKHASIHAIAKKLPSSAGSIVLHEIEELSKPLKQPFILILGGIKLETKIALLHKLAPKAEAVLLGSGVATVLHNVKTGGKGEIFGRAISASEQKAAKKVVKEHASKLIFPIDVVMTKSKTGAHSRSVPLKTLTAGEVAFDLSEHSLELYRRIILGAKSVVWNGPVGVIENKNGQNGTIEIAKALANQREARTIIGGGDTVTFLEQKKLTKGIDFISTGGGAMLAYLSGEAMPGLEVLQK